jgi:hypothetical protein
MDSTRTVTSGTPETVSRKGPLVMLARIALGAMTIILSINIWTGFPLLALWIGSRFAHGNVLSMTGVVMVVVALAVVMVIAVIALTWFSHRYDRLTGRPPPVKQPAPWLRSLRGDRPEPTHTRRETNAIEMIVVMSVVAACLAFEVWFFFLAGSSLPNGG